MTDESLEQPHALRHVPSVASDGTPFEASGEGGGHMTDEEAARIALKALDVEEDYGITSFETSLVKAGYQAAMAAVQDRIKHRLDVLDCAIEGADGDDFTRIQACEVELANLNNWIAANQLKEQP